MEQTRFDNVVIGGRTGGIGAALQKVKIGLNTAISGWEENLSLRKRLFTILLLYLACCAPFSIPAFPGQTNSFADTDRAVSQPHNGVTNFLYRNIATKPVDGGRR